MRILIVNSTLRDREKGVIAYIQNSLALQSIFQRYGMECDNVYANDYHHPVEKKYDVILFTAGAYWNPFVIKSDKDSCFSMEKVYENNPTAIFGWITNEYNLTIDGFYKPFFKNRRTIVLKNYFHSSTTTKKFFDEEYCVNINVFRHKELPKKQKKYEIIYYGSYRPNREEYFVKYFKRPLIVSMISKNRKRLRVLGCNPLFMNKLNWKASDLSKFKFSLYLEDNSTHDNYNHLGDRFYESVMSNTVNLFDKSCIKTLNKSKYDNFEPFIIDNIEDVKTKSYEKLVSIQNEQWKPIIQQEKKEEEEKLITTFKNL